MCPARARVPRDGVAGPNEATVCGDHRKGDVRGRPHAAPLWRWWAHRRSGQRRTGTARLCRMWLTFFGDIMNSFAS